jgi:hypothetical protein
MMGEAVSYVVLSWLAWSEKKLPKKKKPAEQPIIAI